MPNTAAPKLKFITTQTNTLPYIIDRQLRVTNQSVWKGKPLFLIGFSKDEEASVDLDAKTVFEKPHLCIGMYPVFKHHDGGIYIYRKKITAVSMIL